MAKVVMPSEYTTREGGDWFPYKGDPFNFTELLNFPKYSKFTRFTFERLTGCHALKFADGTIWDARNGFRTSPSGIELCKN